MQNLSFMFMVQYCKKKFGIFFLGCFFGYYVMDINNVFGNHGSDKLEFKYLGNICSLMEETKKEKK